MSLAAQNPRVLLSSLILGMSPNYNIQAICSVGVGQISAECHKLLGYCRLETCKISAELKPRLGILRAVIS